MKKIIITEQQEEKLLEYFILEKRYPVEPSKVLIVKEYLDKNFKKGKLAEFKNGKPTNTPVVGRLHNGEVVKNLNSRQLLDELYDEFIGMFSDRIQCLKFLSKVIKDWYNNGISKEGLLSNTYY